jgi:hypothetical protein
MLSYKVPNKGIANHNYWFNDELKTIKKNIPEIKYNNTLDIILQKN